MHVQEHYGEVTSEPINSDSWKRAVFRSAPQSFHVEVLSPEKQGSTYSYGLRIYPIKDDKSTSISARSTSSKASNSEYDIWRKWEDCLSFQDTLEGVYAVMAREKRTRLATGKGVKKNGIYVRSDLASSFASLPPGPHPQSVSRDIHQHIPKLTKKGTIFRTSQATVDQRSNEFRAMINAFFQDGLPTLLQELMATSTFIDFFSYWRRDHDLARKAQKEKTPARNPRPSLSSSMLSAYFPSTSPALSDAVPSPTSMNERRGSNTSDSKNQSTALLQVHGHPSASMRSPSPTSTISSWSSLPSTVSSSRPSGRTPMIVTPEVPITFGHNPHLLSDRYSSDRPTAVLKALPEDQEINIEFGRAISNDYPQIRGRANSAASEANTNERAFASPPKSHSDLSHSAELPAHGSPAMSCTSSHSAAAYLAELDVDFTLPHPHPEHAHRPRASTSSMAPFTAADAIIPRMSISAPLQRTPSAATRQCRHSIFPDEEEWAEGDPSVDQGEDDLLDEYFYDAIPPALLNGSERPIGNAHFRAHDRDSFPVSAYKRRGSLATSISSASTGSSDSPTIAIKATHENSIVVIRVPRSLSFTEVRQRLYDKFVRQEGVPLSESFVVALLVPAPAPEPSRGRPHAGSIGSLSSVSGADKDHAVLHFVKSNVDWDQAVIKYGNKILLRVIGSRA